MYSKIFKHRAIRISVISIQRHLLGTTSLAEVNVPVGIWCKNDVVSTSIRRNHVASTFIRHFYVMCPLGSLARDTITCWGQRHLLGT